MMIISNDVLQSLTAEQLNDLKRTAEELSEAVLIGNYSPKEVSSFGIETGRQIQIVIELEKIGSAISAELEARKRKAEEIFQLQEKLNELKMSMEAQ